MLVEGISLHSEIACQEIVLQLHVQEVVTVRQFNHHIVIHNTSNRKFLNHGGRNGARNVDLLDFLLYRDDFRWHLVAHALKVLVDNVA